jgi:uncharacterized protein (DUF885 family)
MKPCFFLCLLLLAPLSSASGIEFNQLLKQIWEHELSTRPIFASSVGVYDFNREIPDISPTGLEKQYENYKAFTKALNQLDISKLTQSESITLKIQQRRLQNAIDNYEFKAYMAPVNSEYGFHIATASWHRYMPFADQDDYQDYLTRLQQIPDYFAQQIEWMRLGIKTGRTQPKIVMKGYEQSILAYLHEDVTDSPFYTPFSKTASFQGFDRLQKQAQKVISEQIIPAYYDFYTFMIEEYLPASKAQIAVSSWPDGQAYYENRARYFTTTNMSVKDIHQLGVAEVGRIRKEMQQVLDSIDFEGDISDFIHFLRTDPQFYATEPQQLLERAAYLSKRSDALLPKLFYRLPRVPYGVAPVPDNIAPKYTTGRYIAPSADDQPGYYWVNTYALDKRPLYALPALTLHEAVPGHHLQIALARELDDLPPVRRYSYISAFGEGWALYAEYLGKEVGFYTSAYEEFGRLSYEMWRACRLVVDTGMHTMGWNRQQAIDYMLANTALSAHNVTTEIDRYISWPAQALSYKIGELTIKRLRGEAETRLQDKFDIRAFHDMLLAQGSVPLDVLEDLVEAYIVESL